MERNTIVIANKNGESDESIIVSCSNDGTESVLDHLREQGYTNFMIAEIKEVINDNKQTVCQ